MFSSLCGELHFSTWVLNFSVSTFWRPELLVPRRLVVSTYWHCNILPMKNNILPILYETRVIFSYEVCCRKFFYRRTTCTDVHKLSIPSLFLTQTFQRQEMIVPNVLALLKLLLRSCKAWINLDF